MSLILEIEYLSGVCFAAVGPDSEVPDWPPQPDRVFSALVATWGAHREDADEARALEWLETQLVPRLAASDHFPRTAPISFVPPNDPATGRSGNAEVIPSLRRRQARRFPASRPVSAVVRFLWSESSPDNRTLEALNALASDTAYVGHSASLVRCRFEISEDISMAQQARLPTRRIYPGRLLELRRAYDMFGMSNGKSGRPLPGARVTPEVASEGTFPHAYGRTWLLLEHVSGRMPDIRASAIVAKSIRDTLLCAYKRIGLAASIPEMVSGHAGDGSPTRKPHLAIVPLAFAGFSHAEGYVMGFALVPPRNVGILDDPDFRRALRGIASMDENLGRRVLVVKPKAASQSASEFAIGLSPTFEPPIGKRSLEPALYIGPARRFATLTPIVLDRHLKKKEDERDEEIVTQIVAACRNAGLPEPECVIPDKHSALQGAPSAYPSGKSPVWMRWRVPLSLSNRQLTHAVIRFKEPVQGPVILGAGRFMGLGLARPLIEGHV